MAAEFFHDGEKALQQRLGVREHVAEMGRRAFRTALPDQHRLFFSLLPTIHLGAIDKSGHPWAITRSGAPGFLSSPKPEMLEINSLALRGEPEDLCLAAGDKVSVVGVDYAEQRRNRLNGTIAEAPEGMLRVKVDMSFGNCPQYIAIQRHKALASTKGDTFVSHELSKLHQKKISKANMFFIASRSPDLGDDPRAGVDVNHRGGRPGFVSILGPRLIEFPDYAGNNFFQTLGNIALDNRVGLQFVDLESGDMLNVKGAAEVVSSNEPAAAGPVTDRCVRVHVTEVVLAEAALPHRYNFVSDSSISPGTIDTPGY